MSDQPFANQPDDPGSPGAPGFFQNFQHTPVGARVPEKVGRGVFATAMMVLQTNELFVLDFLSMGAQPQQIVSRIVMTATTFTQFLGALRHNVKHYEGELGTLKPRYTGAPRPQSPAQSAPSQPVPAHSVPSSESSFDPAPGADSTVGETGGGSGAMPAHPAFNTVHDTLHHGPPTTPPPPAPITDLYEQLKFPEELMSGAFSNAVMIRHTPEEFCFDFISNLYPRPIVVSRVYASAGRVPSFIDAMSGSLGRYERGGQ